MSPLRHDVRPRAYCPHCGRSISVTFNAHTGTPYLRSHVVEPGRPCTMSTYAVPRDAVYQPPRS